MDRLANFNGNVEEIDNDHSRVEGFVTIFGRSTPVELDFASVEEVGISHTSREIKEEIGQEHGKEDSDNH